MALRTVKHEPDFCVVGGGLAGMCAAISAARHGAKTILVHDRPMLGGNASSEIRMWICGAHGEDNRETGLREELELENLYRNPNWNWSIWDSVLYGAARNEKNLTLLLNCSCNDATISGDRIASIRCWQTTTQTWHEIAAANFADCSGDSILAPLTGAEFRLGREAASEFNEDIEPPVADKKTMGMSCLIQARETGTPQKFIPPTWAEKFPPDAFPHRGHNITGKSYYCNNFWWLELGGDRDSIHDTESLRDELLAAAFGVWDHIKNVEGHEGENWALDWVGFVPGKRESRRYVGDHILTQNEVRAEGRFDDLVAYGGWTLDDHYPAGLRHPGKPNEFHPAPSPFGIPYRCLYSKNIANLFFAGRNISTTHAALSSTRVMATCAMLGQAVGIAAALAAKNSATPRDIYNKHLSELQQTLLDDDCYLPWRKREVSTLSLNAKLSASTGDPEALRNGLDRSLEGNDNGWFCAPGGFAEYRFTKKEKLSEARLVFDTDLNKRKLNMPSCVRLDIEPAALPETLVRSFRLEAEIDGKWKEVARADDNWRRLVRVPLNVTATALRLIPESTWGAEQAHVFSFDVT